MPRPCERNDAGTAAPSSGSSHPIAGLTNALTNALALPLPSSKQQGRIKVTTTKPTTVERQQSDGARRSRGSRREGKKAQHSEKYEDFCRSQVAVMRLVHRNTGAGRASDF